MQSTQTPHAAQLERDAAAAADAAAAVAAGVAVFAVNDLINSDKVKAACEFEFLRK